MSPAQKFLRRVEQTGMVSEPLLAELRKRVNETHRNMRPEMLAKLLVDRGELTAAQARKLVSVTVSDAEEATAAPPPPPPPPATPTPTDEPDLTLASDEPELDFLREEEDDYAIQPLDEDQEALKFADEEPELDLLVDESTPEAILIDDGDDLLAEALSSSPTAADAAAATSGRRASDTHVVASNPVLDEVLGDAATHPTSRGSRRLTRRRRGLTGFLADLVGPRRPRKNRWDSPLILLGGGALILLVAAGIAFFALFYSENAEEIFTAANDAYASQSYVQAAENFARLNAQFPRHEKASLARVRIQMAKIRQITDGNRHWEQALAQVASGLPLVKQEASFDEVRPELAKLLPDIAAGLVEEASAAETADEQERLLQLADDAMQFVDNPEYLPTSVKTGQERRIEDIMESILVVRRGIERDRQLQSTLDGIRANAERGDIAAAYRMRDDLLARFPILADHTALADTLRLVAAKEKDGVHVENSSLTAFPDDRPAAVGVTVVLSDRRGPAIGRPAEDVVCVLLNGAVYGIRVASGEVLWRRFVGFATTVFPQPARDELGSDFIIVDAEHGEVQRRRAENGSLRWRLPCPLPIYTPRIDGDRLLICCGDETNSLLLSVDGLTGQPLRQVRFPVGCVQSPTVQSDPRRVFQLGTHSSMYVLDAESLQPQAVITLDHDRSSVTTQPTIVGDCLVVAVNQGSSTSRLHVFRSGEDGAWSSVQEPIALGGQVISNMVADGRRVVVTTDEGEIHVLEAPLDQAGLRSVARLPGGGVYVGPTFALLDRADLWIANQTFGRYELQATRGAMVTKWVRDREDRFLHPLYRRGDHIVHVRARAGMMGATVAATEVNRTDRDGSPAWETDLGVPSDITVNSKGAVHATTVNGAMFPIDGGSVRAGVTSVTSARVDPRLLPQAFTQRVAVAEDLLVRAGPPPTEFVFTSNLMSGELRRVPLRLGSDVVTTNLVAYRNGVLAACDNGPIFWLDPTNGQRLASPFLPRIEPGTRIPWLPPTPFGDASVVAAERSGHIYTVRVEQGEMRLINEHAIQGEFVGGLAAMENVVYAVTASSGQHEVVPLTPEDLSFGAPTKLRQPIAWGPQRVGAFVLAVDEGGMVYAFDGKGTLAWTLGEPVGTLSGTPLASGDKLILTSTQGTVWVIDRQGQLLAKQAVGEPLGSGAVAFNGRLLMAGWDGTLYLVNVPE